MFKRIQKYLAITIGVLFCSFAITGASVGSASAAGEIVCGPNEEQMVDKRVCCPKGTGSDAQKCITAKYINPAVELLAATAAIAVVIGMMFGGIQYAASAGDPQKAAAGKGKVIKALYGLVGFLLLFSVLQFLTPGGLSGKTVGGTPTAAQCSSSFLTLKTWFAYLPPKNGTLNTFDKNCQVENFQFLPEEGKPSMLPTVFLAIADNLLRIAALVAVAFVIIGGIQYVTSQGEPDRTKRAQESIINALIGLVIVLVAAAVVGYIGSRIGKI